jgi:hypothetical protein
VVIIFARNVGTALAALHVASAALLLAIPSTTGGCLPLLTSIHVRARWVATNHQLVGVVAAHGRAYCLGLFTRLALGLFVLGVELFDGRHELSKDFTLIR